MLVEVKDLHTSIGIDVLLGIDNLSKSSLWLCQSENYFTITIKGADDAHIYSKVLNLSSSEYCKILGYVVRMRNDKNKTVVKKYAYWNLINMIREHDGSTIAPFIFLPKYSGISHIKYDDKLVLFGCGVSFILGSIIGLLF